MIYEGDKVDYEQVIKSAEMSTPLICKHDFWELVKTINFGDIILCHRCSQYFTKIRNMPWLVKGGKEISCSTSTAKIKTKTQPNHKNWGCMVRVPIRITDEKE